MWTLPIQTQRLLLRQFAETDVDGFYAYRSNSEVGRYQGWHCATLEQAREFIDDQLVARLDAPGKWFQIAIVLRQSQTIIGDIGLCLINAQYTEIGVTLAPEMQRQGYAAEAVMATVESLFRSGVAERVQAVVDSRNERSIALLERLGFDRMRTAAVIFHGELCEEHRFEMRDCDKTHGKNPAEQGREEHDRAKHSRMKHSRVKQGGRKKKVAMQEYDEEM